MVDGQIATENLQCLIAGLLGESLAGVPVSLGLPNGQHREGPRRAVPRQVHGLETVLLAQVWEDVLSDEIDGFVDLRRSPNRDQTCVHDPSLRVSQRPERTPLDPAA